MSITVLDDGSISDLTVEPSIDIVAVHGLYENSFETWKDLETEVVWLRDLLPLAKLKARVLLFNYDADALVSPGREADNRILPHATNLVAQLCAERQLSHTFYRPILFICHGFGGIVVKRALILSSGSRTQNVEHRRSIYTSTYAIIFMATPHEGMSKDAILLTQRDGDPGPSQFTINLLKGSSMLQEISDQFAPLMKQFLIYHLWEQQQTNFKEQWAFIVDEDSAAPLWHVVDRCGVMATHSGMVKFKNVDSPGFKIVFEALLRYIKNAPALIKSRWENDQKLQAEERQNEASILLRAQPAYLGTDLDSFSDANKYYIVPRCSCNHFTGRQTYGEMLKDKFNSSRRSSQRRENKVFVVYGLGGSGKTQFCLRYGEDNRSRYLGVFWIDASCEENAESGFAYLGQQSGKGSTFSAGKHWLSNISEPWLLVIDNADDPEMDVSKYFPAGGSGHIIITTRNPGVVTYATVGNFHFGGMDPEEAVTLLLRSADLYQNAHQLNVESRSAAREIASELGYLALALAYAGATIRRKIYTLERYLYHYLGSRKKMLSMPPIKTADDANIITTWEIPFQKIATRKSVEHKDAVDLLHLFAFLHFDSVPELIFQKTWFSGMENNIHATRLDDASERISAWREESHARLRRALGILCGYSIIDHDPEKKLCSLHPVVHQWAKDRLPLGERKRWLTCTASVLEQCISPLEASGQEFRRLLLPHVESCLRALRSTFPSFPKTVAEASQAEKFAAVYAEKSMWRQARSLQQDVVNLRTKIQGKWHDDTLKAQSSLGDICWGLFDVESTVKIHVHVMRSRWWLRPGPTYWLAFLKPDHISYCKALSDITLSLWLAGRYDLSQRAGERAVAGLVKRLGPDDPQTLTAMFNLARTYLHLDKVMESRELLTVVVRKRKLFFGLDHLDTLLARHELGMCLRCLGRLVAAEKVLKTVHEKAVQLLGEEHAYTLWSIIDVSKVVCDLGCAEEAALMVENILPILVRTLGEHHGQTDNARLAIARAYALGGRLKESATLLKEVISTVPEEYPMWLIAMLGYIHVLSKINQPAELETQCNKMLDHIKTRKVLSLNDPRTLEVGRILLGIYQDQHREDDISVLRKKIPGLDGPRRTETGLFKLIYGASAYDGKAREKKSVWS